MTMVPTGTKVEFERPTDPSTFEEAILAHTFIFLYETALISPNASTHVQYSRC